MSKRTFWILALLMGWFCRDGVRAQTTQITIDWDKREVRVSVPPVVPAPKVEPKPEIPPPIITSSVDRVAWTDDRLAFLFGPLPKFAGSRVWPWAQVIQRQMADHYGAFLFSHPEYQVAWTSHDQREWPAYGAWINGSNNVNYYDSVLAHYATFHMSGDEKYRNFARTLASRWLAQPYIDRGDCVARGGCVGAPRLKSLAGLYAYAIDGNPEVFDDLWKFDLENMADLVRLQQRPVTLDVRENGYNLGFVALCAKLQSTDERRATCKAAVTASLTATWDPAFARGVPQNRTWGYAPWNGWPGTAAVTRGSRTVTGTGTRWNADANNQPFIVCRNDNPQSNADCDRETYTARFVSATELTLDRPYEGETRAGQGWQYSNLLVFGTQPFTLGVLGTALEWAYGATGDPRPRNWVIEIAKWLRDKGFRPETKGLYYGRGYPNCEPIREGNKDCAGDPVIDSRFLNLEVFRALAAAYRYSGDPALRDFTDKLYGATFGGPASQGPHADGTYALELDGVSRGSANKAKDFGFAFGMGMSATWEASR